MFERDWTTSSNFLNYFIPNSEHNWEDIFMLNWKKRQTWNSDDHTSWKHGKKEPQSFFHCGSFDHHALRSLNNYKYVFLDLPTDTLGILGLVIYRSKGIEITFWTVYHMPQDIYFSKKWKIKFCNHLVTANQGGQKNRNGKRLRFYFAMFSTTVITNWERSISYYWCSIMDLQFNTSSIMLM